MKINNSETNETLNALSQGIGEAVERVGKSIVAIDARPRVRTSGVVWRPGVVVSTNHTIKRDEGITIATHEGREVRATLAGRDAGTDLAVLRVEDSDAEAVSVPAQFAAQSTLKPGNLVLAVGRTSPEWGVSASFGIVNQIGGAWRTWRGGEIDSLIRLDLAIYLGFSGGALIDLKGNVLGINTSALARGAGLTIPAATVDRVVNQLLARGRVARPYLGVGMQPIRLPEKLRAQFNIEQTTGLLMLSVEPDAPADKAGMVIGDVLLKLDDALTTDTDDVQTTLGTKEVGAIVRARILRGGEIKEVEIALGERPAQEK